MIRRLTDKSADGPLEYGKKRTTRKCALGVPGRGECVYRWIRMSEARPNRDRGLTVLRADCAYLDNSRWNGKSRLWCAEERSAKESAIVLLRVWLWSLPRSETRVQQRSGDVKEKSQ